MELLKCSSDVFFNQKSLSRVMSEGLYRVMKLAPEKHRLLHAFQPSASTKCFAMHIISNDGTHIETLIKNMLKIGYI